MKKLIYVLIGVVVAAVSSCSINTYNASLTDVDVARYRVPDSMTLVNDSSTMASLLWQDYYSDYNLQCLIDTAIARNLSLYNAMLQVDKAATYVCQSNGSFFPNINLSLFQDEIQASRNDGPYNLHGVSLGITDWEIDLWGRLRNLKKSRVEALMKEQWAMQGVKVKLIADVATLYYRLVGLDAKLHAVSEIIDLNQHYLDELDGAHPHSSNHTDGSAYGSVVTSRHSVAVEQARAELFKAKAAKPRIENEIFVTENAINLLLARTEGEIERVNIEKVVATGNWNDTISVGVPVHLISYRPDVMAAENAVREAFAIKDAARAAMYPRLTISGSIATEEGLYARWTDFPSTVVYNLFAGLTQPLFRKGELRQDWRYKKITANQKVADFQQTLLSACVEVSNTLASYNTNREVIANLAKRYEALFNAYTYSRQLYHSKRADYLDVLLAQNQLLNARFELSDAMTAYYTNRIALYLALGGGAAL